VLTFITLSLLGELGESEALLACGGVGVVTHLFEVCLETRFKILDRENLEPPTSRDIKHTEGLYTKFPLA